MLNISQNPVSHLVVYHWILSKRSSEKHSKYFFQLFGTLFLISVILKVLNFIDNLGNLRPGIFAFRWFNLVAESLYQQHYLYKNIQIKPKKKQKSDLFEIRSINKKGIYKKVISI